MGGQRCGDSVARSGRLSPRKGAEGWAKWCWQKVEADWEKLLGSTRWDALNFL